MQSGDWQLLVLSKGLGKWGYSTLPKGTTAGGMLFWTGNLTVASPWSYSLSHDHSSSPKISWMVHLMIDTTDWALKPVGSISDFSINSNITL